MCASIDGGWRWVSLACVRGRTGWWGPSGACNHPAVRAGWTRHFPPWSGPEHWSPSETLPSFLAILPQWDRWEAVNISQMFLSTSTHRCTLIGSVPLVQLVYPRELLTSYWPWAGRGMSRMLEMWLKLSSDARLLCSSGPVCLVGGELPTTPPLTSVEPQLFLLADSLSRLDLTHTIRGWTYKLPYIQRKLSIWLILKS